MASIDAGNADTDAEYWSAGWELIPKRELTEANSRPDYFRSGVNSTLRWAPGFPHHLSDQGLENVTPADGFGSQASVLTWTARGLQYAWVVVAGALPSLSGAFAVAMNGLRPAPDERSRRMVVALVADIQDSWP